MSDLKYIAANEFHMGQINLVKIKADLALFGNDYKSFAFNRDELTQSIKNQSVYVAVTPDGIVAGFIKFIIDKNESYGYLDQISTSPDFLRQGIAKSLIKKMIKCLENLEIYIIGLTTASNAPWGMTLYKKNGFETLPESSAPYTWQNKIKNEISMFENQRVYMEYNKE